MLLEEIILNAKNIESSNSRVKLYNILELKERIHKVDIVGVKHNIYLIPFYAFEGKILELYEYELEIDIQGDSVNFFLKGKQKHFPPSIKNNIKKEINSYIDFLLDANSNNIKNRILGLAPNFSNLFLYFEYYELEK